MTGNPTSELLITSRVTCKQSMRDRRVHRKAAEPARSENDMGEPGPDTRLLVSKVQREKLFPGLAFSLLLPCRKRKDTGLFAFDMMMKTANYYFWTVQHEMSNSTG